MVYVTFILYCRAGVYARRTDDFLIFIMCGGVKTPPYKAAYTVVFSANPAQGTPLPGGNYASPTNKATAYASQKCCHWANGHGGRSSAIFHFYFLIFNFFSPALHKTARGTRLYKQKANTKGGAGSDQ